MLERCEALTNSAGVVVIDKGDSPDNDGLRIGGLLVNEAVADEVAEGLGAVAVAAALD